MLRQNLEPVPTVQVVKSARPLAEVFFRPASHFERAVNHSPFLSSQLAPSTSWRWLLHILMYRPQNVLNRDTLRVDGSLDCEKLRIPLVVLELYRLHGWVHSGGDRFFLWEVIIVLNRLPHIEFEKILGQYGV